MVECIQIHVFLNYGLVGGEWSCSRPRDLTPGRRARGTDCQGRWVNPPSRYERRWEEKITCLCPDSNWDTSTAQLVAKRYTDSPIAKDYV
jgi:hypothetical protein